MKLERTLIKGSIILLLTFNLYNFLNFIFQFSMARLLSINDYGVLASLFSIIYILSMLSESVQTAVTKYASEEVNKGKIKNLFKRTFNRLSRISFFVFVAYAIISIALCFILNINYFLLLLNGLFIFSAFLLPIPRGVMQGKKRFTSLGINLIIESLVKLVLAVSLVFIGWKVYGAIFAAIVGSFLAFIISLPQLKDILKSKELSLKTPDLYARTKPMFIILLSILTFYSVDIIIARALFPEEVAGAYALASVLGKIIFWGTQPISKAMFPLSSKKSNSKNLILNALGFVSILIFMALVIFYFFGDWVVLIFSGKSVPLASGILIYLGIANSLIAISNLILLYKISINQTKGYYYMILPVISEIVLLILFSHSLLEFSLAFVVSSAVLLWCSINFLRHS